jgi:chromosome segregation ATPase
VDTEELKQQLTAKAEQFEEAHQAKALLEDRLQRVETELKQALATASSKDVELDNLREQLESTLSETEQKRHVR